MPSWLIGLITTDLLDSLQCAYCVIDSKSGGGKKDFAAHLLSEHRMVLSTSNPNSLLRNIEEPVTKMQLSECLICDVRTQGLQNINWDVPFDDQAFVTPRQFRTHLGKHMENLALFALLAEVADDSESDDEVRVIGDWGAPLKATSATLGPWCRFPNRSS
jgi:hypothetical protein